MRAEEGRNRGRRGVSLSVRGRRGTCGCGTTVDTKRAATVHRRLSGHGREPGPGPLAWLSCGLDGSPVGDRVQCIEEIEQYWASVCGYIRRLAN